MSIGASELIAADFGRPTTAFERSWRGPNERTPRCSSFSGHCISVPARGGHFGGFGDALVCIRLDVGCEASFPHFTSASMVMTHVERRLNER